MKLGKIMAGIVIGVSLLLGSLFHVAAAEEAETGVECVKRNVETGELTTYKVSNKIPIGRNLEVKERKGMNMPESRILVNGTDNRYKVKNTMQAPYSYTVYLVIHWKNGDNTTATGWMMGKSTVVTAGHCTYIDDYRGGWAANIEVYPAKNGYKNPYGYANVTNMNVTTAWINEGGAANDYGILELDREIGVNTGYFGYQYQGASYNGTEVTIGGYPGEHVANNYTYAELWKKKGKISSSTSNVLRYKIDTTGGQSGAPVYLDNHQVIGIHSGGYGANANQGKRIDEFAFNWFSSFN